MPFRPDPFLKKFERLRRLRQNRTVGYMLALASVAAASLVRLSFSELLISIPFGPYYLAVAFAGAVGGGGPGLLALGLSVVSADYLAPPAGGPALTVADFAATGLFVLIAGILLTVIWLLNHAVDRIWLQAENTRLILESQPAGVIGVDSDGRIELVNSAVERQLGYPREELFDQSIERLVPFDVRAMHSDLRTTYMKSPTARMMGVGRDLHAVTKEGSLLPVEIGLNPVSAGGKTGTLATIIDISERKDLERRTQILANEIHHRARNLLTVIQALALRKLPRDISTEFMRTLDALARTQGIFGTETAAPLRTILESELADFEKQTTLSGCRLLLTPGAAQDFSLIVHELATNALKYGALADTDGTIDVDGRDLGDGTYRLVWTERRGSRDSDPPKRAGYGGSLLQEIAKGLHAEMKAEFLPEGFRYELVVPLDRITNVSELAPAAEGN